MSDKVRVSVIGAGAIAQVAHLVVLNKLDLTETRDQLDEVAAELRAEGIELLSMSAATGEGIREVLEALWRRVRE